MLTSVYVLAMGAATPAQAQAATRAIAAHGITPTACSVYCAAFYLDALFAGGQAQAAISAMTADTETSWQHMIDMGAGSMTEAWDPSIKGNMSYSHAWATGPAFMVPDGVFGISSLSAGWSRILIAPPPGTRRRSRWPRRRAASPPCRWTRAATPSRLHHESLPDRNWFCRN